MDCLHHLLHDPILLAYDPSPSRNLAITQTIPLSRPFAAMVRDVGHHWFRYRALASSDSLLQRHHLDSRHNSLRDRHLAVSRIQPRLFSTAAWRHSGTSHKFRPATGDSWNSISDSPPSLFGPSPGDACLEPGHRISCLLPLDRIRDPDRHLHDPSRRTGTREAFWRALFAISACRSGSDSSLLVLPSIIRASVR